MRVLWGVSWGFLLGCFSIGIQALLFLGYSCILYIYLGGLFLSIWGCSPRCWLFWGVVDLHWYFQLPIFLILVYYGHFYDSVFCMVWYIFCAPIYWYFSVSNSIYKTYKLSKWKQAYYQVEIHNIYITILVIVVDYQSRYL